MNAFLVAIASILTLLAIPVGGDLVLAFAAVVWGVAMFALVSDALDDDDKLMWVRALIGFSILLSALFAGMGGLMGFLLLTTSLSLSFACVWQRRRLIA